MAVIDVAGFVADLKDHAVEHGFHVHDELHFVESYSLRQTWEVDAHPEEGCEGPVDLYLSLEIDPRVLLGFEDVVMELGDEDDPLDTFFFPLNFTWGLPPLTRPPDLLVVATELAGVGGPDLPLEVSAIDSIPEATEAPERALRVVARQQVSLLRIRDGSCSPARHDAPTPLADPRDTARCHSTRCQPRRHFSYAIGLRIFFENLPDCSRSARN